MNATIPLEFQAYLSRYYHRCVAGEVTEAMQTAHRQWLRDVPLDLRPGVNAYIRQMVTCTLARPYNLLSKYGE